MEVSPADPIVYVLSLNLHRRQLTPSQRAMVAARAREIYDRQAKERQIEGQKKGRNNRSGALVETLPPSEKAKARDQAGKAVGVSGKYVDYATKVIARAEPEIVKAVDEGRMAVDTAAIATRYLPKSRHPPYRKPLKIRATFCKHLQAYPTCIIVRKSQAETRFGQDH